jgi:hypothetical protein
MMLLIWGSGKAEYFSPADWTAQISLKKLQKKVFQRQPVCCRAAEETPLRRLAGASKIIINVTLGSVP